MARIPGFHPGGPGSIPGVGEYFFKNADLFLFTIWQKQFKSGCVVYEIRESETQMLAQIAPQMHWKNTTGFPAFFGYFCKEIRQ